MPALLRSFAPWLAGAAVCALAVCYILALRGDVATLEAESAQKDARIMELTANAQQQRIEAKRDIEARDAAVEAQKAETEKARQRARNLADKMEESNETCFDKPMPVDVLDSLRY